MDYVIAKKDGAVVKVYFSEILYIETIPSKPRILRFITDDARYEMYGRMKDFEVNASLTFTRCHRRYLVNLRRVKAIDKDNRTILFDNSNIQPIECSRRNRTEVFQAWKNL